MIDAGKVAALAVVSLALGCNILKKGDDAADAATDAAAVVAPPTEAPDAAATPEAGAASAAPTATAKPAHAKPTPSASASAKAPAVNACGSAKEAAFVVNGAKLCAVGCQTELDCPPPKRCTGTAPLMAADGTAGNAHKFCR
jgi:hypothetical protein